MRVEPPVPTLGRLANAVDVGRIVHPFEGPDHVVIGRQAAFPINDPTPLRPGCEGIEHDPHPLRSLRMAETRLVFETARVRANAERRADGGLRHDIDDS